MVDFIWTYESGIHEKWGDPRGFSGFFISCEMTIMEILMTLKIPIPIQKFIASNENGSDGSEIPSQPFC
jgi:hypothetical protein